MIRHAIAVPRGTPDIPDDERPLTKRGRRRFRSAARGLACLVKRPDFLLSSPLPRAADRFYRRPRMGQAAEVTDEPVLPAAP
jgi:phosphohistidine phosphatase SixA